MANYRLCIDCDHAPIDVKENELAACQDPEAEMMNYRDGSKLRPCCSARNILGNCAGWTPRHE